MQDIDYPIDWFFEYPENCTPKQLRKILREKAAHWHGWQEFPWYLSRTLHRHIDGPPADWDHLHDFFWMSGLATHVLLKGKFEDRNAVINLLIEEKVQFPGILRHMILDEIRWCLIFAKQDRLPDCALWGANTPEGVQAVEEKRTTFQDGVEHGVSEFVRVLNFASEMRDPNARIAGHPLRTWYRGAHLPEVVEVPVGRSEEGGRVFLRPVPEVGARFLSRRLPIPRIELCGDGEEADDSAIDASVAESACDEDASRKIAFRAFELAMKFAGKKKQKAPTYVTVLKMYCCDDLGVNEIARRCGCAHGTVSGRKRELEELLGVPLEVFQRHAAMLKEAFETAEYAGAKIHPKSLLG